MKILVTAALALLLLLFFINLALADICTDVERDTGLDLNEAECYVLKQVEKGALANFNDPFIVYLYPKIEDRTLRADFLRRLLMGKLPNLNVIKESIYIWNAHVSNKLYLDFVTIPFHISLNGCIFEDYANFRNAQFSGKAAFEKAQFSAETNFFATQFSDEADFRGAHFSEKTYFRDVRFTNKANFNLAQFSAEADFLRAQFLNEVYYVQTQFSARADFSGAQFGARADFRKAQFSAEADFRMATFSIEADFSLCRFKEEANFVTAIFPPDKIWLLSIDSKFKNELNSGKIPEVLNKDTSYKRSIGTDRYRPPDIFILENGKSWMLNKNQRNIVIKQNKKYDLLSIYYIPDFIFNNVTGFSKLQLEWEYSPKKFGKEIDEKKAKRRGLRGHLYYNETFYIALIKNYRDMGWFKEADDAYYTYRVEKRRYNLQELNRKKSEAENKPSSLSKLWKKAKLYGEYLLLDFSFGYGVKPKKLLRTLLILWISFSFYYVGFLRNRYEQKLPWWKAWNPLYKPLRFTWALLYSFDKLTPAIKLDSLKTLNPNVFVKENSRRVIYVERFQNLLGWYWFALFLILFSRVWIR